MKTKTIKKDATAKDKSKKPGVKKAQSKTAIDLLKEDHAEIQNIFKEYRQIVSDKEQSRAREKRMLVRKACDMLTIHAQLEEELFYPVVRRALDEEELMNEALVEHDGAKDMIAQLKQMRPEDRLYDAKFIVLGEMVKHHIREEESEIFPKAKKAGLDLERLGQDLACLKEELEEDMRSFYGENRQSRSNEGVSTGTRVYASSRMTSYGLS